MERNERAAAEMDILDGQQEELFEQIGKFAQSLRFGEGRKELVADLTALQRATISHFTDEETLLRTHSAPKFFEHRQQHRDFLSEINRMIRLVEQEGARSIGQHDVQKLGAWLATHISLFDMAAARHRKDLAV